MRLFRHFILSLLVLSSTAVLATRAQAALPTAVNGQITDSAPAPSTKNTKDEQKQALKQGAKTCPEGKSYCCTGQDAEGFDKCGCFSSAECAEADNN